MFQGPTSPNIDGLSALAKSSYNHHAYVDRTPVVQDVNFSVVNSDWHTLLVGGLGKGGKAYYALDVTDPVSITNETELASKVKWEFKNTNLGFSYGKPVIVKTKASGWVVILPSGYNNADGKGHLFIVDPKTGVLIKDVKIDAASDGLAHVSAFVNDFADGVADAAYAGDLQGNLWRIDLTKDHAIDYSASLIAKFPSQPITTPPLLALDTYTDKRFVFVGTGKLLASQDIQNNDGQSFYAIIDGTSRAFLDAPSSSLTRADLQANNDVTGVTLTTNQRGWYIDLGSSGGNAYRINTPMMVSAGVLAFAANLPDASDVCNPSGTAKGFGINFSTGASVLSSGSTNVSSVPIKGLVQSINFYNTYPFDKGAVISFNSDSITGNAENGCPNNQCKTTTSASNSFKVLNWREIPSTD